MSTFLTVPEVAARYRAEVNWVHKQTRKTDPPAIPHLKRPGMRGVLFPLEDLDAWDAGAPLEVVQLPDGGRRVRPVQPKKGSDRP
jgi:hypothetical protein